MIQIYCEYYTANTTLYVKQSAVGIERRYHFDFTS